MSLPAIRRCASGGTILSRDATRSGFCCNFLRGWIKDERGRFPLVLMPVAVLAAAGTVAVVLLGRRQPHTVAVQL